VSLATAYRLWAPLYDPVLRRATAPARRRSLERLRAEPAEEVLLAGVGTGLDLPHLPTGPRYRGCDLTPAMLARASGQRAVALDCADVQALPYADAGFDAVVAHLILAVVPDPAAALAEMSRVTRPGGRILVFDKFLRPGQRAPLRRLVSPLLGRLATRTDVILEELLEERPELTPETDEPALAGGWFRQITLRRQPGEAR